MVIEGGYLDLIFGEESLLAVVVLEHVLEVVGHVLEHDVLDKFV